jgi:site-specific recombinase XerD
LELVSVRCFDRFSSGPGGPRPRRLDVLRSNGLGQAPTSGLLGLPVAGVLGSTRGLRPDNQGLGEVLPGRRSGRHELVHARAKLNERLMQKHQQWMVLQQYSRNTMQKRSRTIRLFTESLKGRFLTDADHNDVRSFVAYLADSGVSLSTANDHLTSLRMFYDFLNIGGMIGYVPPRLVRIRSVSRRIPDVLSEPEIFRMLDACRSKREKAFVELAYGTGCRPGELRTLRIEDIDFDARSLRVSGKSGVRVVPLGRYAENALRLYIRGRKSGFVFRIDYPVQKGSLYPKNGWWTAIWRDYNQVNSSQQQANLGKVGDVPYSEARAKFRKLLTGVRLERRDRDTPLSHASVDRFVDSIGRRAGLKQHVHAHMLRHSFATHLLDHGADIRVIQQLLGHAKLESTATYTRVSTAKMTRAIMEFHPREIKYESDCNS